MNGEDLKQLDEDMQQIPAQAIRFTVHQSVEEPAPTLNIDDVVEVFVMKYVSFCLCIFLHSDPKSDLIHFSTKIRLIWSILSKLFKRRTLK